MTCGRLGMEYIGTRPVTGILVLKILVPWTEIFGGKMVPQDPFFQ